MRGTSAAYRILSNSGWLVFGNVTALVSNLAVTVVVARHLGPESFGVLSYCVAAVALVLPLSELGLVSIVTRDLVRDSANRDEILGTVLALRLLAGTMVFLAGSALVALTSPHDPRIKWYLATLLFGAIFRNLSVFSFWFEANLKGWVIARCEIAAVLLLGACKIAVVIMDGSLSALVIVHAIEGIFLGGLFTIAFSRQTRSLRSLRFSKTRAATLLKQSWALMAGSMTAIIYLKVDQVMLGQMAGHVAVGMYAVASRISEAWYFVPTAIVTSAFPLLLRAQADSRELYEQRLQWLMDALLWFGLGVALLIFTVGPYVIPPLFGSEYAESAGILVIHIWAGIFVSMRALASKWLLAEGLMKFSLLSQASGAICNVCLNFVLIPPFGAYGAAVATLVSYSIASYFSFWVAVETRPIASCMTKAITAPIRLTRHALRSCAPQLPVIDRVRDASNGSRIDVD